MIKVWLHPNNNWLEASEYTLEEQAEIYDRQLQDIIDNPRWYLDNLERMSAYRVTWHNYHEVPIVLPFGLVRHQKQPKKQKLYK